MRPPQGSFEITQVWEWHGGGMRAVQDMVAAEEPLEIRVNGSPLAVTMRTPGSDLELATGFLLTEGIVESPDEITTISAGASSDVGRSNVIEISTVSERLEAGTTQRNFYATSSCGICGKASIEAIRRRGLRRPDPTFVVDPEVLFTLPERIRAEQAVFEKTGGLHAAALFDGEGRLLAVREDIGRHNAVDKLVGWAMRDGRLPLSQSILMVSGRGGFEIVQKALAAGVPVLASVSAPSSLAVKLARELGLTLVGFLRGERFVVYSGESRCLRKAPPMAQIS